MADTKGRINVRVRKFMTNPLLQRKQFVVEVSTSDRGTVPKKVLQSKIARMYKVKDDNLVILWGFNTVFGGGKARGFGVIYDSLEVMKKVELRFRLVRLGLSKKKQGSRKQLKERKNRMKKFRGLKKAKAAGAGKKKK
eukprot:TRINITY_DN53933_c0_g1_i1.p3 TRINITY_DN53933_c0_g1~~TRINITY_DN53933_c0_g1_i1.p3  ORF type:complete len:138 (-),score=35.37 TRINITY_DN53933_c0_g1_i1:1251-1664(-)